MLFSIGMRSIFSPFILLTQLNSLKMQLLAPEMEKYRAEMMACYQTRNSEKLRQLQDGFSMLKQKYHISTGINVIPLLQLPFVLFFFWTLQEMTYNIDVYPSMTTDGFLWFKNLSEPDPYLLVPIGLAFSSFYSIHKNPSSSQLTGAAAKYFKYFKYITFLGIPVTASFPVAIVLNWFFLSFFQVLINSLVYTARGKKILGLSQYLPGSILEKYHSNVKTPVIKPVVFTHKPNLPKPIE